MATMDIVECRVGETVVVDHSFRITVVEIRADQVVLEIDGPDGTLIDLLDDADLLLASSAAGPHS
jgi:hypothetical protein